MKHTTKRNLGKKGWTAEELDKVEAIIDRAEPRDVHFSKIVFWSALVVIVFGNIIVSVVLIPFLIALNTWVIYALVVLMAGIVGFLYNLLITDIGHLRKKHHVLAGIIIPILAFANMIIMVLVSNRFAADLKIKNAHEPLVLGIIFAVVFIIPAVVGKIKRNIQGRKAAIVH